MKNFLQLLKIDLYQRIRTYRFFIMIVLGLYLAAGFVPAPDASYSTINLGDFRPVYNSVWVGAMTAMMSSLMIFIVGFFLVDGSIGKDKRLKIDLFIKSGMISRKRYFLLKAWSNTALLSIITVFIFGMAIVMYFIRRESPQFSIADFLIPFATVTIPAVIFTGHLAVILEALTGKYTVVRVLIFIFSMALIFPTIQNAEVGSMVNYRDALGLSNYFNQIRMMIDQEFGVELSGFSMGYQFFDKSDQIDFVIKEFHYPLNFLVSRLVIPVVITLLVMLSASLPEKVFKGSFTIGESQKSKEKSQTVSKKLLQRPTIKVTYSQNIVRLILLELKSLVTFKKQWINWVIATTWVSTVFIETSIAHTYLLPIMILFSSNKIAALGSRVYQTFIDRYTKAFPLFYSRQLMTHMVAVLIWLFLLAFPLLVRLSVNGELMSVGKICTGLLFLVTVAQLLGAINKSPRLFEIILVLITYFLVNGLPWFDYLGALSGNQTDSLFIVLSGSIPILWLLHHRWVKFRTRR